MSKKLGLILLMRVRQSSTIQFSHSSGSFSAPWPASVLALQTELDNMVRMATPCGAMGASALRRWLKKLPVGGGGSARSL